MLRIGVLVAKNGGHGPPMPPPSRGRWQRSLFVILFPAIDLKDGVCVRLKKGVMADATVFNTDPGAQAKAFAE